MKKKLIIIVIFVLIIIVPVIVLNFRLFHKPANPSTLVSRIQTKNQELLAANTDYQHAPQAKKIQILTALKNIAQQRKDLMLSLMQTDPHAATQVALNNKRTQLPAQIQPAIEKNIKTQGNLELMHADNFQNNTEISVTTLESNDNPNRFIDVFFAEKEPTIKMLQKADVTLPAKITGFQLDNRIVVPHKSDIILQNQKVLGAGTSTIKNVLVLPFNFSNYQNKPQTPTLARARMPVVKAYYTEQSYGQYTLKGKIHPNDPMDIVDWITIPNQIPKESNGRYGSQTNCLGANLDAWTQKAHDLAQAKYGSLSGYSMIIYLLPDIDCNHAGGAEGGGNKAWFFGQEVNGLEHEIGHSINGILHSSTYSCLDGANQPTQISNKCTYKEYGDPYNVMGAATGGHFNAVQKEKAGWFGASNIQTVTKSGTYTLAPIEKGTSAVQEIRVPIDSLARYYLEFRQPIGFDTLAHFDHSPLSESNVFSGILIHLAPISCLPHLCDVALINAHPTNTAAFAALTTGDSFYDPLHKIAIQTVSVSKTMATVKIVLQATKPLPTIAPTATPTISTNPVPTFYCIVGTNNNCVPTATPTVAATPTVSLAPSSSVVPSNPSGTDITPTSSATISGTPSTQNPCVTSQSEENEKAHGHENGFLSKFIALILQFILKLLELLLGVNTPISNPCSPATTVTPSTSPTETAPSSSPSISESPTVSVTPTTVPTVAQGQTATVAPTKVPAKTPAKPKPAPTKAAAKTPAANTSTCKGKYKLTNPRKKNFGDPSCDFTKNKLYAELKTLDAANASKWFNTVVPCESSYNPNAFFGGSPDAGGAWGLFQMGQGKNGKYDHGDVVWNLQASNAVNYNKKVIHGNWRYWACAKSFWK